MHQINRWRIVLLRSDDGIGASFYCTTPAQRSIVVLALTVAGVSFSVEEYAA